MTDLTADQAPALLEAARTEAADTAVRQDTAAADARANLRALLYANGHTGEVRVEKGVAVGDGGRVVNPQTAASQTIGGVTRRDAPETEVLVVASGPDNDLSPLGARGVRVMHLPATRNRFLDAVG